MNTRPITRLLTVLIIPAVIAGFSMNVHAGPLSLQEKLNQCQTAFDKAHSGDLTQAEAAKARREHVVLAREILEDLNKRNAAVDTASGKVLSQQEILDNLRVMGRLLEMLVIDHQGTVPEWSYVY
jgi:hypothetical protein